jgi:hypothetical protein
VNNSENLLETRPALSVVLTVLVGAVAYAAITFVMRGTVRPLEVGLFAVPFAAVYVAFARYSETFGNCLCAR